MEYDKLDSDWINEFDEIDTSYTKFYKEPNDFIAIKYVYLNKNNMIEHVKQEKSILRPPNILSYNALMDLIRINEDKTCYQFDFILIYNLTVEPNDVKYITYKNDHQTYIRESRKVDSIKIENTISMFQDLNEIIIFYIRKKPTTGLNKTIKNYTKRYDKHKQTRKYR